MFVVLVLFVVVVVVFVVIVFVDDDVVQRWLVPVDVVHTKYIVSAVLVVLTGGACTDF